MPMTDDQETTFVDWPFRKKTKTNVLNGCGSDLHTLLNMLFLGASGLRARSSGQLGPPNGTDRSERLVASFTCVVPKQVLAAITSAKRGRVARPSEPKRVRAVNSIASAKPKQIGVANVERFSGLEWPI